MILTSSNLLDGSESDIARPTPPRFGNSSEFDAVVPDLATIEASGIVGLGSRDLRARPFALLRSQIMRRLARDSARLIGITSATPAAGKSFVALNLAAALAKVSDQPVWLVDLDLRRGSVAIGLGLDLKIGLSDFLEGNYADLCKLGCRVEGTNLVVVPTRPIDGDSAELLAGDNFEHLVDALRAIPGDPIVLCDLPPVLAGDDAMLALERLDAYIMIVDAGKTTPKQILHANHLLEPTPVLGAVLNRFRGGLIDGYAYGGGYGYENEREG